MKTRKVELMGNGGLLDCLPIRRTDPQRKLKKPSTSTQVLFLLFQSYKTETTEIRQLTRTKLPELKLSLPCRF